MADIDILSLTINLSTTKWNPLADYSNLNESDYYWAKNEITIQNNTANPVEFGEIELFDSLTADLENRLVTHILSSINEPGTGEIIPANSTRTITYDTNFVGRPLIFEKIWPDPLSVRVVFVEYPRDTFYTTQFDVIFYGCANSSATNYDARATQDDGTCILPDPVYGCTDPNADNYDPNATHDDGSCTYAPLIRTGLKGWATLEEYDILNYQLTGNEKPNDPEDPDYVPPVYDPVSCPPGDDPL